MLLKFNRVSVLAKFNLTTSELRIRSQLPCHSSLLPHYNSSSQIQEMDPFPAYRIALKESIYIGVVPDFYIQLNICAALCAISLAAAVGSVGVRVWRSQFWLFRSVLVAGAE